MSIKICICLRNMLLITSATLLTACLGNTIKNSKPELGAAENTVGDHTQSQLIKCQAPLGVAALVEDDIPGLTQLGLASPIPLLRLMMSRSGCFQVVDRGRASAIMRKERALLAKGELQEASGPMPGEMVAADYLITPNIIFHDEDTGGHSLELGLGALASGFLSILGGGIDTTKMEAQTLLTLTNVRTGVQESVAEGSARKQDISYALGALGLGSAVGSGLGLGSYEDTDIGKLTAFAFQDAYNKLIINLKDL